LLLQYNCSTVESLDDLSIIKDRVPATDNGTLNATFGPKTCYVQGNTSTIYVQNQTELVGIFQANNIHAVAEVAHRLYPSKDAYDQAARMLCSQRLLVATTTRTRPLQATIQASNKRGSLK
jgi:hypothetical protein